MKIEQFKGFYEVLLEECTPEDQSVYSGVLKYCPSFFKLLCNILKDERTDWYTKLMIDAALAYFVVPDDVISEKEHGVVGYVDDVFLCAYVLNEIKSNVDEKLLIENWDEKGDILQIVDEVYEHSKKIVGDKKKNILQYTGLHKQNNIPSINKRDNKVIERLIFEREELIGLLVYLVRVLNNHPLTRKTESLKEYISSLDKNNEIQKIISVVKHLEMKGEIL